jgi:hypothetical protein
MGSRSESRSRNVQLGIKSGVIAWDGFSRLDTTSLPPEAETKQIRDCLVQRDLS